MGTTALECQVFFEWRGQHTARGPHSALKGYFFCLEFPFLTEIWPASHTNKGAMWPANENSCPPLGEPLEQCWPDFFSQGPNLKILFLVRASKFENLRSRKIHGLLVPFLMLIEREIRH